MKLRVPEINRINVIIPTFIILIAFSKCMTNIGFSDRFDTGMSLIWTTVCTLAVFVLTEKITYGNVRFVIRIGFVVKMAIMIIDIITGHAVQYTFGIYDYAGFMQKAEKLYYYTDEFIPDEFPKLICVLFRCFGMNHYLIQLLSVFLSTLSVNVVYKTFCILGTDKRIAGWVILLLNFMPFMLIFDISYMREPFYFASISFSVYYLVRWIYKRSLIDFILSCVTVIVAAYLQSDGFLILITLIVWLGICYFDRIKLCVNKHGINYLIVTLGTIVLLPILIRLPYIRNYDLTFIGRVLYTHIQEGGGSMYLPNMQFDNSLASFLMLTPIRLAYFFISPMPWDFRGIKDAISFLADSFIYLIIFVRLFVYIIRREWSLMDAKKIQVVNALLMFVFSSGLMFAWGTTTAGTAIRHRKVFLIVLGLLYGIIVDGWNNRKKAINER